MKKIVKHGILNSSRGPNGGFYLRDKTLCTTLCEPIQVTTMDVRLKDCVLRFMKWYSSHPCTLHRRMEPYREDFFQIFTRTTIGGLLNADQSGLIRSILA